MQDLSADTTAMETYSDYSRDENADQVSLPAGNRQCEKGPNDLPTSLETNQAPEGEFEPEKEHTELLADGNYTVSEEAHQFDNLITSDCTPSPPLPTAVESEQDAFAPSSKLEGAGSTEGIPNLEETTGSRVALPENHHLHETVTPYSDADMCIQEISDSAFVAPSSPTDKENEKNLEIYTNDETSPSLLPGHVEYESADTMFPLSSNDLPIESSKLGDVEETLAGDHNERDNELEKQRKLFKSISPGLSLSSPGIPAPSLVSSASQIPAGKIVIPATVDPTQENAVSALQSLKVPLMNTRLESVLIKQFR